jgi:hypothetical protein
MKANILIGSGIIVGFLSIPLAFLMWFYAVQNSSMSRSNTAYSAEYQRAAEFFTYAGWGVIFAGVTGGVTLIWCGIRSRSIKKPRR